MDHYSLDLEDNYIVQTPIEGSQKQVGYMANRKGKSNEVDLDLVKSFQPSENGGRGAGGREKGDTFRERTPSQVRYRDDSDLSSIYSISTASPNRTPSNSLSGFPTFAQSNGKGIASSIHRNENLTDDDREANKFR